MNIPDFSFEPLASAEEIARHDAEIDAEIAASQAARLRAALAELNNVPSYCERYKTSIDPHFQSMMDDLLKEAQS